MKWADAPQAAYTINDLKLISLDVYQNTCQDYSPQLSHPLILIKSITRFNNPKILFLSN